MNRPRASQRLCASGVGLAALAASALAAGTPRISPPVVTADESQLFTLVVEPEQEGAIVTVVELYSPPDFRIDSFPPTPGWHRDWTIQSARTLIQKATWTREEVPTDDEEIEDATEQDALFQFVATPTSSQAYSFEVRQTYADGAVIHWRDRESVAFPPSPRAATIRPAPTLVVAENGKRDGGGSSTLAIVALVVGAGAFVVAVAALLASRRSRAS